MVGTYLQQEHPEFESEFSLSGAVSVWVSSSQSKYIQLRCIGKLSVGVNVSVNGCLTVLTK